MALLSGCLLSTAAIHTGLANSLRSAPVMSPTAQGEPPVANIDYPANNTRIQPTQVIRFDGSSSHDPDGGPIEYLWEIDPMIDSWGFPPGSPETRFAFNTRVNQVGNYTITLTVTDADGNTATTNVILEVKRASGSIASETTSATTVETTSATNTKPILTVRPNFLPGFSVLPVIFAFFVLVLIRRKYNL